jgi:virulence factor
MPDSIKIAAIGAGGMANGVHYPSLASFPDVHLAALCDLDTKKLEETAAKFGFESTFTNHHKMLEAVKPDAVYALMPPHHVFDVAMDVLQAGIPLFVEKPPAVTTEQARAMGRLAGQQGVVTAVGFQRRYHPLFQRCFEEVKQSGPVHQVVSTFYKCMPPADPSPYYRGAIDILRCDAIHAVDSLRFYAGLSPVKAVASEVRELDCAFPVSFNALVYFENGTVGILLANWRSGRRVLALEFHSTGAYARMEVDGEGSVWKDDGKDPVFQAAHDAEYAEHHVHQGFLAENRAFIDAVKSRTPPHNSIPDAVHSMALADQIYAQAINTG